VSKRPGSRVFISPGSLPVRPFRCLKRSITSRVRASEPRLEAVLYPASGFGSSPASRPSARSGTPISCALNAQTSHEHVGRWVVNNYTKFICLRESSDGASPFISATAIQLTPSLPSYTTIIIEVARVHLRQLIGLLVAYIIYSSLFTSR